MPAAAAPSAFCLCPYARQSAPPPTPPRFRTASRVEPQSLATSAAKPCVVLPFNSTRDPAALPFTTTRPTAVPRARQQLVKCVLLQRVLTLTGSPSHLPWPPVAGLHMVQPARSWTPRLLKWHVSQIWSIRELHPAACRHVHGEPIHVALPWSAVRISLGTCGCCVPHESIIVCI